MKASQYVSRAEAYDGRGQVHDDKEDYDRAIEDFSQTLQLNSPLFFANTYNLRGITYMHKGDYDRAIEDFGQAMALDPKSAFLDYNLRGQVYMAKKDFERAIGELSQAITLYPARGKPGDAYYFRGIAFDAKGDYDKAIEDFNQSIPQFPKYPGGYFHRGQAYMHRGDYDKAIEDYTQALSLPSTPPSYAVIAEYTSADGYYNRGLAFDKIGQHNKAVLDYTQAEKLKPSYAQSPGVQSQPQKTTQQPQPPDTGVAPSGLRPEPTVAERPAAEERRQTEAAPRKTEELQAARAKILDSFVGEWTENFLYSGHGLWAGNMSGTGRFAFVKKDDNTLEGYQNELTTNGGILGRHFTNSILFLRGTFANSNSTDLRWVIFPLNGNQEGQPLPNNPQSCTLNDGWPTNLTLSQDGHQISFGYTFTDFQSCYPKEKLRPDEVRFTLESPAKAVWLPGVTAPTTQTLREHGAGP